MKEFFISECSQQENKIVTSSFVVASKQVKAKKNGEPYLALILADRTGQIEAKMWDNVDDFILSFEQDDFLKIKGLINKYKNRFQLTIHKLRRMEEGEIDFADYLPKTTKDIGELWQTLAEFVATFQNPHLKALVELFMADAEIAERYRNAPAAKTLHHAYIGGLLDHVVSLFCSCDLICRNYPQVNRDLLLTGAFLHDIGKLQELTYNRAFSYTTRGQLLGHMIIELEMLQAKLAKLPDFPAELKTLLEHMMISHHGQYEFGSPKLPMFPKRSCCIISTIWTPRWRRCAPTSSARLNSRDRGPAITRRWGARCSIPGNSCKARKRRLRKPVRNNPACRRPRQPRQCLTCSANRKRRAKNPPVSVEADLKESMPRMPAEP